MLRRDALAAWDILSLIPVGKRIRNFSELLVNLLLVVSGASISIFISSLHLATIYYVATLRSIVSFQYQSERKEVCFST